MKNKNYSSESLPWWSEANHSMRPSHNLDSSEPPSWPIPDGETLEDRWIHRNMILSDTASHLRVHPHEHITRNIVEILHDRQTQGTNGIVSLSRFRRRRKTTMSNSDHNNNHYFCGDRSPSTVLLESPVNKQERIPDSDEIMLSEESIIYPKNSSRRVTYPTTIGREIRTFGEHCSATKYHSAFLNHLGGNDVLDENGSRPASSKAVSTISIAFAPNGATMASTHGDHTVKISCCSTGRLLESLEGHPRTPWTVKYHPTNSSVVASGCLGHQVRIWNWPIKSCLQMIRLEYAIISLSFHPSGTVLAIANGTRLHFWGVDNVTNDDQTKRQQGSRQQLQQVSGAATAEVFVNAQQPGNSTSRATLLTEMDQRHMLRCVHFPPDGKTLIIGGVNPPIDDPRRRSAQRPSNNNMSFYLRLWDFDLQKSLEQPSSQSEMLSSPLTMSMARRAISNPKTFVPRALLYNDGGFDVSPDGKTLCACAEYWLPDGVDNAMEQLHKEELAVEAEMREMESLPYMRDENWNSLMHQTMNETSAAQAQSAVSAALAGLRSIADTNLSAISSRCREEMNDNTSSSLRTSSPEGRQIIIPEAGTSSTGFVPRTPPVSCDAAVRNLSPPPPPGSRFIGGILRHPREEVSPPSGRPIPLAMSTSTLGTGTRGISSPPPPPPPPPPPSHTTSATFPLRPPHPLSIISATPHTASQLSYTNPSNDYYSTRGRYVPHVVMVSLDTTPVPEDIRDSKISNGKLACAVARGYRPRLGQLLEACPLDPNKASAVTCVKFSPSTDFCLIGYGVREPLVEGGGNFHPVTAIYRIRGGMTHVSTMLSGDDDVNIARFHPDSGHSFVYGTKQGRVRVLSPRPWNFYGSLENPED